MSKFLERVCNAWAVLTGEVEIYPDITLGDAALELRHVYDRLLFATKLLKELPMALIDEISALGVAVDNAIAAAVATGGQAVVDLAAAQQMIADRNAEISAASDAVVALTARITPAPVAVDPTA
jgi:hypothetical protein